jgi:hypothetical protein
LGQLDECAAFVAAPPARPFSHLEHSVQLPIIGTVLPELMSVPLAHYAHLGAALLAHDIKRVLWVDLVPRGDEFAAACVGAEYPCFPRGVELEDRLEE